MEDIDGLLGIAIDSVGEDKDNEERKQLTDEEFQREKASWKPRIEQGEVRIDPESSWSSRIDRGRSQIWKTLNLPPCDPSKAESQRILHAIEELYFYHRFNEAIDIADQALVGTLNQGVRNTLLTYRTRCKERLKRMESKQEMPTA